MGPGDRFKQAAELYARLKSDLEAGRISGERFEAALKESMVEHEGRWWMLGANTGKWYVHDGGTWAESQPPAPVSTSRGVGPDFDVILQGAGDRKVAVVAVLRQLLGKSPGSLSSAKYLAENTPATVSHGIARSEADEIKRRLEAAGATVDVRKSPLP